MLSFGFYTNHVEVIQLLKVLFILIDVTSDISIEEEKTYKETFFDGEIFTALPNLEENFLEIIN
jgi:hypothetical protein